jgi:hypothetical protein
MATSALSRAAACACLCLSLANAAAVRPSPQQQQQPANVPPQRPAASSQASGWLDLRISPVFDLYYFVRKHATSDAQKIEGLDASPEALAAMRELHKEFGGWFTPLWSLIDANLIPCRTADDAAREFADIPERREFRGKTYRTREPALRLARALQAVEPQFLKSVWPEHRAAVEEAAARLARTLRPKERDALAFFSRHLRTPEPRAPHPVYLVAEAQYPGAFTNYTRDTVLSIVSVRSFAGTLLEENVLHEAAHSLDVAPQATPGAGSVFAELRDRLRRAGVAERDLQDAAHLVLFVTAAEAVRQLIDPAHKHYGDVTGVYTRLPSVAAVAPVWRDYLGGKMTRARALDLIVERVPRADPPKPQTTPTAIPTPSPTPTPPAAR